MFLDVAEVRYADRLSTALECLKESSFDVVLLDLKASTAVERNRWSIFRVDAPRTCPSSCSARIDDDLTATSAVQKGVQDYLIKGQVDSMLLMRSIRYALEPQEGRASASGGRYRYRTIFDNSAVAIMMVDKEERLVSWNKFTEQLLGMTEADLLGRSGAQPHPDAEWRNGIRTLEYPPEGHAASSGNADVSSRRRSDRRGYSPERPEGHGRRAHRLDGVVRDITERRARRAARRQSEERFRQVVENAREWIWEVDASGLYTYASPIIERILGYAGGDTWQEAFL